MESTRCFALPQRNLPRLTHGSTYRAIASIHWPRCRRSTGSMSSPRSRHSTTKGAETPAVATSLPPSIRRCGALPASRRQPRRSQLAGRHAESPSAIRPRAPQYIDCACRGKDEKSLSRLLLRQMRSRGCLRRNSRTWRSSPWRSRECVPSRRPLEASYLSPCFSSKATITLESVTTGRQATPQMLHDARADVVVG